MYLLVNRYTHLIFGVFATYDAAYAHYEAERDENLLVDLYEIPDSEVAINMDGAHRIERPTRESVDANIDWRKYDKIMGLVET